MSERMRKKLVTTLLVIAAIQLLGCGNGVAKEISADSVTDVQTQETSAVEESVQETFIVEETESVTSSGEEEIVVEGNKGTITIGTIGTPYTELLTQAKILLAKEGWDVRIETYTDYNKMNQDLVSGTLDAHLFAHQSYIDSYNDVNGTELIAAASICYEKYGIYSKSNEDLTKIQSNAVVGIPKDDVRKARALLFLEDLGYLTLKEGVGITAILEDIMDNPKNIQFVEYTQDTVSEVLATADYCVMGADQAILAGFEPEKEVLKEETPQSESAKAMAALLVTTTDRVDDERFVLLESAVKSEAVQEYMEDTYKGAWGLFP